MKTAGRLNTGTEFEELEPDEYDAPSIFIDGKPGVELPGDGRLLSEFAGELSGLLKDAGVYRRGGCAFVINRTESKLESVDPNFLRTWVELELTLFKRRERTLNIKRSMSKDVAGAVCVSPQFLERLPEIKRFSPVRMPVIRECGKLELLPLGFDAATLTFTDESALSYPLEMNQENGKRVLDEALAEFSFVDERSKSVAVAAMLTVYAVGLLPPGSLFPCFIYLANAEGAGKTTCASLAAAPFNDMPMKTAPTREEEWQKRLLTLVMSGQRLVILDNLRGNLNSPSLEAYLSAARYGDRVLGVSREFTGDADAVILITGNRLTVTPDMRRRSLFVELSMAELRAEDRKFNKRLDPPAILAMRPQLLEALWALVRGWDAAGRPPASRESASFPRWSDVVGGIVEGAGWACPTEPAEIENGGDTDTRDVAAMAEEMEAGREYTFAELVELCTDKGLFERFTDDRDDSDQLSRKAKSAFAKALKVFHRRSIAPGRCFHVAGKGKTRRYLTR